jgi:hypothetical protein
MPIALAAEQAFSWAGTILVAGSVLAALVGFGGGVFCLHIGHKVFTLPDEKRRRGDDSQWKGFGLLFRNRSVGGTVMATACLWALAGVKALPDSVVEARTTDQSSLDIRAETLPALRGVSSAQVLAGGARYECDATAPTSNVSVTPSTQCRPLKQGEKCGPPPKLIEGLGRLQVIAVSGMSPLNPLGTPETLEKAHAKLSLSELALRKSLNERGGKDWSLRLMRYTGVENKTALPRLVFNNVAPEVESAMCSWLECEGWTPGPCKMVRVTNEEQIGPELRGE